MTTRTEARAGVVCAVIVVGILAVWLSYEDQPPADTTLLRGDGVLTENALGSLLTMRDWSDGRAIGWAGRPRFIPALIQEVMDAGHVGALPDSEELGAVWILPPDAIYVNAGDDWIAVGIGGSP